MTTDVAGRRKQLLTRGAELGPIRSPAPGILVADGRDPEGNVFHIESRLDRPTDPEAAEASVRRALQGWVRAFNEGDWERYLEFYADDGRFHLHEVGRTLYTSRAAVEEAFRSTYSAVAQASLVAEQVALAVVSDRVAVIAAEYRQTLAFADGTRLDLAGSMHLLLERSAAGWRIVAGDGIARQ